MKSAVINVIVTFKSNADRVAGNDDGFTRLKIFEFCPKFQFVEFVVFLEVVANVIVSIAKCSVVSRIPIYYC